MRRKGRWTLAVLIVILVCAMIPQHVLATSHGDFTDDGKIGSQDAIYLLRHVLNPQDYGVDQSADINGDGKVNTKDALHLLRHALNPQGYPVVENHEPVTVPGKAASCTVSGLTDGSFCAVCEKTLQEQTVIPAPGHSYADGVCKNCGAGETPSSLDYQLLPDGSGYRVIGVAEGTAGEIVVPDTYNGLPVTAVASQAFTGSGITAVTLGKNITHIASCAFYRCPDLRQIVILAEDVVFGGSNIVYECDALETVHFAGDPAYWEQEGFHLDDSVRLSLNYGHNYSGSILKAADCTHTGITQYTCRDCGRTYQQQTQALGHYYSAADQVKPTCTEDGSVDGECTRCGLHTKQILPATGHSIESYTQQEAPSCENEGSEIGMCTQCQQWFERAIPALAHTPGEFIGSGEYCGSRELGGAMCTVCGQTAYIVEHTLHTTTNLPTCTEAGSVNISCANCDYSVSSPIAAGGHSAGQWEITQDATCAAAGTKVRKCVDCAAVVETGVVPKRDHETVAEISGNSCTYSCCNCDHTETVSIENKKKVTFVTGCDPELAAIYVDAGQTPELPTPTQEDYTFVAWYVDEEYCVLYEGTPITGDTTLYALWEPENITASDNGYQGIVRDADVDYQFVVKSPIVLTNSNLGSYITVTSSMGDVMEIFVAKNEGDRYYIGGNYAPGDIYEAVAVGGILFEESGADPLWFVVTGSQRENVEIKDATVKLNKDQFFGWYSDDTYDYIFSEEDLLNVGQLVVLTDENGNDLYAIYEVVGKEIQGSRFRYQCAIPDPKAVISQVDLFGHITVDMSKAELQEGWEDAVIQSVRTSRAYAAFQYAASEYALQCSANDSKYTYTLTDFDIDTTRKKVWSSSTGRTEMVVSVEVSCKLERRNKTGGAVVDISTLCMTLENRFSADADISASGILGGDARIVLTTHNTVTADFVLKFGLMDDDDSQEEYFRNLYQNALDKKDLLPIDTVPDGQETLVPAFYLPIPLGAGFALDIDGYVMLDWEVCGEFGVSVQFNNTMSFGFELRDWSLKTVAYHNNTVSMHAYLAGKMRSSAGFRPEIGLSWAKIVRAGANVTISVYAESGGLVGFTASNKQDIIPQRAGYFECGVSLKAQLFGEIGYKWLSYRFDYTLFDKDYPVFSTGTKEMPLGFESDGEEYIIYMDYDSAVNLLDRVDVILRSQSLGTMEIDRGLPEKCFFTMETSVPYVELGSDGALRIHGCTQTEFDLNIRITSGTVYKNIVVHVRIDHTHVYTTTYYSGSCTKDEYNFHECDNCTYEYREVLTKAPGHDYSEYIVDKAPTCVEDGKHHGFCARCGEGSVETIPALGHDYSLQILEDAHLVRAATCQNPARYYYVCVNCGGHNANRTYEYGGLADHSYEDPYTCHDRACTTKGCSHISYATTAHPFTEWIHVEPGGCCEEGYDIRACRDCGYTETTLGSGVIKQHDWQLLPAKAPTCSEPGYQDYIVCVVCNQVANKTEVPTLNHILLYKDVTDKTHVAYCHRVGCDYESQPLTHTHTDWTVVYPAECEKEGLEHGICVCGHVGSKPITALKHQFTSTVTKPASCTQDGVKTYTCHCGESYTETIPAKGHTDGSPVVENKVNATCTENGSYDEVVYCTTCHTELRRDSRIQTKLGHQNGTPRKENETNSTCQKAGSYDTVIYCTRCHKELSRKTQSRPLIACKPGPEQIENETNSTCTVPGTYDAVTYCTMCGGELSRKPIEKPLADHTPGPEQIENETDSTCAVAGQYDVVTYCTVCKTELSRKTQYKPLAEHTPGPEQIENETDSTCTVAGQYDVVTYCTVCKTEQSRKTEYKPLIDCVSGPEQIENETDSTCTVAGRYDVVVYCTVCKTELSRRTEDKPLAEHTPGPEQIENVVAPACEKDGRHDVARYCTVCGEETSRVTVPDAALSHDVQNAVTDYDSEYHWKVCAREGCDAILEKTRHDGTWVVESYSTCIEYGTERYRCGCGYETTRPLELADHDHTGAWQTDGAQHYRICGCCQQPVDMESHTYSGKMFYDQEQHYRYCSVCGLLGDLGYHIPVPDGETKKATCTEDGYTPYKCPTCDYQWNGDIVHRTGHDWSTELAYDDVLHYYPCRNCGEPDYSTMNGHTTQTRITVEPTCTEPGYQYTECVICDYSVGESLDPLNHDRWSNPTQYDDTHHWIICGRTGCGAVLDKTAHQYVADPPVKPDCVHPGFTIYNCSCGHSYKSDPVDALGHSGMNIWRKSADGDWHYHACDRDGCGYETDRGLHTYGPWQTVVPETCSAYGTRERYCTVCNEVETDDRVPMLPHDVYESVKTETVTITGGVEYHHYVVETCRDCDYSSKIGETVVSSHAQIVPLNKVWPTCTEIGWETGWNCAVPGCTDPSHSRPQVQIPALGHNEVDGYCTRCGAKNNDLQYTLNEDGNSYRVTGTGNCTDTDIRIPAIYKGLPVTMIGTSAFAGDYTITSVHIPDTVDTIMWYAFYQCSNLTQVHIPNSVTRLGGYAFFGCTNLTAIDLPDNLTAIQEYTFYGCTKLGAIEIPANVTTIDCYAFQGCSSLTSVTIPGNVTQIGKSAFERCRGLTRIDIPLSVTSFGDVALYNCTALEYIYYAGTTVQWEAITKGSLWDSGCTYTLVCLGDPTGSQGLAYTLSSDGTYYIVSGIGTCTDTEIVIPETYQGLPVREIGICAFDTKEHEIPIETVVIPDSVITIGRYAFRGNASLYSVTLGNAVQTIGDHAFDTCSELKNIDLPSSLTAIGSYALPNLYTVNIPANVTSLGEFAFSTQNGAWVDAANMNYSSDAYGVLFNKDKTRLITAPQLLAGSYTIPNTVTSMDMHAFGGCTGLTEITIPYGVSTIEQSVFSGCTGLKTVTIAKDVTTIGSSAFAYCTNLQTIYFEGTTAQWEAITKASYWNQNCPAQVICLGDPTGSQGLAYTLSSDGTYYIVSGIGDCTDTQILIPETYQGLPVKEIGNDAFSNCTGITSISIPEGVTTIGQWAFNQCTGLTEITIPQSATTLGNYLFYGCTSLKEVALPNGVTAVITYMFYNCTGLERVEIPESVTTIGSFAFYNCTSLKWVEIPAKVKTIGSQAFCNSGLTSLVIPDSVTVIGTQAFSGCTGLMEVTLSENLTQIGTQVFYNCTSLTKITIPAKVTSISTRAFAGCTGLTEITIPVSVTSISGRALQECTGMQTIYYEGTTAQWEAITKASYWNQNCPGQVVCLGDYDPGFAFELSTDGTYYIVYGTNELTDAHVVIPSMYWGKPVKEIGDFAFGYNTMTAVTIPATIERINDEAFTECYDLTAVYITDIEAWCRIEFGEINAHPLAYARNLYLNGTLVQNLQIPGTVSAISDSAFQFCDSLVTVTIGNGVSSIGYGAFYGCQNLTRVDIPASVTSIGAYAFHVDYGTKLAGIWVDAQNPNYSSDAYGVLFNKDKTRLIRAPHALSGTYTIPSTVQYIEADAFNCCDSLTAIIMGKNVVQVGDWAFDCWDLEYTYYGGSVDDWNAMDIGTANNALYQTVRYYSETRPAEYVSDYWHYVNGIPTLWS